MMCRKYKAIVRAVALIWLLDVAVVNSALAINISVDYSYDTNGFFNPGTTNGALARNALEAAANRISGIIDGPVLTAVEVVDDNVDARFGFLHPGTGRRHEISAASSLRTDRIVFVGGPTATEYRDGFSIAEDEWILYAGARPLTVAGFAHSATGANFSSVFDDPNSILNRGFRAAAEDLSMPLWGGSITFDSSGSTNWHFDHTTTFGDDVGGAIDFYSVALHEISHVLGVGDGWHEWTVLESGDTFRGENAVAAFNQDNQADLTGLEVVGQGNHHWKEGLYQSLIFPFDEPNLIGTVGLEQRQDLLLDPTLNFSPTIKRLEITNVEVGALEDIGWIVERTLPLACDLDLDSDCDIQDLDVVIQQIAEGSLAVTERDNWLSAAGTANGFDAPLQLGDANLDGIVDAIDLNVVGFYWTQASGLWSKGDFDGSGTTDAVDLNKLGTNWLNETPRAPTFAVPEPSAKLQLLLCGAAFAILARSRCLVVADR